MRSSRRASSGPPAASTGSELRLRRVHRRVPAWIAMIPPAVRSQRTSSRPAAAIRAASSSGPGKRRTLLGR